MGDKGKIVLGLAVFVILVTFPFWGRLAGEAEAARPDLDYPEEPSACVEDSAYMTVNHMNLLNQWRDSVVREGGAEYTSSSGRTYQMSLTKTCLDCHGEPDNFCTRCHNYSDVAPTCWECHTTLGGGA